MNPQSPARSSPSPPSWPAALLAAACGSSPSSTQRERAERGRRPRPPAVALHPVHALPRDPGLPRPRQQRAAAEDRLGAAGRGQRRPAQSAENACQSLWPYQALTPAQQQQELTDDLKFAQCMRSHGAADPPRPRRHRRAGGVRDQRQPRRASTRIRRRFSPRPTMPARAARGLAAAVGGDDAVKGVAEEARQAGALVPRTAREPRGRGRWVAVGIVIVVAAGAVSAWRAGVFSPAASSGAGQGAPPPATAAVTRQDLSATTPVTATLGYAGSYPVTGQGSGTLTWLPSPGQVIRQGQALYQTGNGSPVVLLYGSVPDWRALRPGRDRPGRVPAQPRPGAVSATPTGRTSPRSAGTTTPGRRLRRAAAGRAPRGRRPAGFAVARAGRVRAGGAAGQPGDRPAWAARRPGRS